MDRAPLSSSRIHTHAPLSWDVDHVDVAADDVHTGCQHKLTQDIQAQRMDGVGGSALEWVFFETECFQTKAVDL